MTAVTTDLRDLVDDNILSLGMRADDARRAANPDAIVRYQRVHVVRSAEIRGGLSVPEAASEVRLLDAPSELAEAVALVRTIKETAGSRLVSAFSLSDLAARAATGWGSLRDILAAVASAGVADLAELPVDGVDDLVEHVHLARDAGLLVRRLTVSNPPGNRTLEVLERVRACCESVPGIERFAPLGRQVPTDTPTTGYDDVRMVALSRLALSRTEGLPRPEPASASRPSAPLGATVSLSNGRGQTGESRGSVFIEVDWSLCGPKLAQVALTFGADFLDAVPATSDPSLGRRRETVQDVERNIRAAGFEPLEYRPQPQGPRGA